MSVDRRRRASGRRQIDPPPPLAQPVRRWPPSLIAVLLLTIGELGGALTVAFLCLRQGPSDIQTIGGTGTPGITVADIVFIGFVYAALAAALVFTGWLAYRRSLRGRTLFIATQIVVGAVSAVALTVVGPVVAGAALLTVLLLLLVPSARDALRAQ